MFDVLNEEWIPVVMTDGSTKEYGLLDLFENANEIKDITDPSPLVRYGIMRLLIAFVTDVFRPKTVKDMGQLLEARCFDIGKIKKYIADCKVEMGCNCFDLFDKSFPFLQTAYDSLYDKEKSVANIFNEIPSGNNHTHFLHLPENEHAYCPAVCIRALCAVNVFALAMVQEYPSGINNTPPWFVLIKKENMFESILVNTLCEKQIENSEMRKEMYYPPVAWRDKTKIIPKKVVPLTSYLRGLTWTARRICLIPDAESGTCTFSGKKSEILIRKIWFSQGWNSNDKGSSDSGNKWIDPHVGYTRVNKKNKEEIKSIKPSAEDSAWRDLAGIAFGDVSKPLTVFQYINNKQLRKNEGVRKMELELFSLSTDNAKVCEWFNETFSLRFDVIENDEKSREIKLIIQSIEEAAAILKRKLSVVFVNLFKNKSKGKKNMSERYNLISQAQVNFFSRMREYFFDTFIPALCEVNIENNDWRIDLHNETSKKLVSTANAVFVKFSQRLGSDSATIVASVEAEKWLGIELSSLLNTDMKPNSIKNKGGS